MMMEHLYPWHKLASDLALAYALTEDSQLQIATELSKAIQTSNVQCWQENGDPIRGAVPFDQIRRRAPHLTVAEGNAWLKRNGYLQEWKPVASVAPPVAAGPDYSILATRQDLIDAYGAFTGMDIGWVKNVTDSTKLQKARKVLGAGLKGRRVEPLFCPYEVMEWLIDKKRRKGRPIASDKAWEILEKRFFKVYNICSPGDTRTK
jgi:hypothetical protein